MATWYLIILNLVLLFLLVAGSRRCLKCCLRERSFKKLIGALSIGHLRFRLRDGAVTYANSQLIEILGLGELAAGIVGSSVDNLFVPIDPDGILSEIIKGKKRVDCLECSIRTLSGGNKIVKYKGLITSDPLTHEDTADVLMEDVTEKMGYYGGIRESCERYEKLFKCSGDMVIVFDIYEMTIKEANPVSEEKTGFLRSELISMDFIRIIHPMDREKFIETVKDLVFAGKAWMEIALVRKNGFYLDTLCTLAVTDLENKKTAIAVIKDISLFSHKQQEEGKRKEELEDLLSSSVEREERISDLKASLLEAERKIRVLEGKKIDDIGSGKK